MSCDVIRSAMAGFDVCEATADGARMATHCLYPSFEAVHVFVVKEGDTFTVHDNRGAYHVAWSHARDERGIAKALESEARRHRLKVDDHRLIAGNVPTEWLRSAILTVANASAAAANAVVAKSLVSADEALVRRIDRVLSGRVPLAHIARGFTLKGISGGERNFDFAVRRDQGYSILISGVTSHHASYFAKYVAFSDVEGEVYNRFAVKGGDLKTDVEALMQRVASIVPLAALPTMNELGDFAGSALH